MATTLSVSRFRGILHLPPDRLLDKLAKNFLSAAGGLVVELERGIELKQPKNVSLRSMNVFSEVFAPGNWPEARACPSPNRVSLTTDPAGAAPRPCSRHCA